MHTRHGRSGPRSRLGCVTCKQRRVRCDETHPVCGHCRRLQFECRYQTPKAGQQRRRQPAQRSEASQVPGVSSSQPEIDLSNPLAVPIPGPAPAVANELAVSETGLGDIDNHIDYLQLRRGGRQRSQQQSYQSQQRNQLALPDTAAPDLWAYSYTRSGYATPNGINNNNTNGNNNSLPWTPARRYDFFDVFADLDTSWAGEFACVVPEIQTPTGLDTLAVAVAAASDASQLTAQHVPEAGGPPSTRAVASGTDTSPPVQQPLQNVMHAGSAGGKNESDVDNVAHLMQRFHQIVQPPAAILIGGFERWRRLQHYLCKLGDKSRAVRSALLCLIELLAIDDDGEGLEGDQREKRMQRILERHASACQEIEAKLGCSATITTEAADMADKAVHPLRPKTREHLLAAIFLLSWFEVIRDQDSHTRLFPRHLAERVITSATTTSPTSSATSWSRYSQQLLSWLNTLDSKAAHMGRETLLSPKTLEAVAHFPIHITSSLDQEHGEADSSKGQAGTAPVHDDEDSELSSVDEMSPSSSPASAVSMGVQSKTPQAQAHGRGRPHRHQQAPGSRPNVHGAGDRWSPQLAPVQVKQVLLRTVLQPALEWYLTSQSYCRRISAHDKHHRRRFTSDDEYEVILAGKQLESELFALWDDRPDVMSLTSQQLRAVVAADVAKRLEAIFSVYLASFWILFVHLHRISWWHLPHSALARRALDEVWQHMQRAYGEEISVPGPGPNPTVTVRKVIHPSLLWPVFLFGSECSDPAQAQWAIEQLEALGEAKPVLEEDAVGDNNNTLPPFRLSSGATRNAKRAALLLRQLIKEQTAKGARVDDRDLSMRLFGCYFSII
ncbi:uncharacterized protein SPSK_01475 [Sporothrix schenckii 1099-18]|uniref:Zn(2)-C6 fungal-type domain-containing protein n=1 Tax=Sporothrix schenckii 1099-18 TaxID=1397361 RepID=A0A0F2MFE8_SPOSC|nr:uncharacterized protein SPSK_01475 [Sporothrix schenckii 1099-18]KJR87555.1 hypothetical protein SPSK_01475 [Sporothrix schenckii 1099-18]